MRGVYRGGLGPQSAGPRQQAGRRQAGRPEAVFVLLRLLGHVNVERHLALGGPCGHPLDGLLVNRPDTVDGGADADTWLAAQPGRPRRPGCPRAVSKAPLSTLERAAVQPTPKVAGVEQSEADARLSGGRDECLPHPVGVVVWSAIRLVVQVVELAHDG